MRLAFARLGVAGENVEDERRAVDDLDLDDVLERAPLRRGKLGVGDHCVRVEGRDEIGKLMRLSRPQIRRRVRERAPLDQAVEDLRTRGLRQRGELPQGILGLARAALAPQADEDDPLEANLPVFDVDALFARNSRFQALDPLKGGPLLPFECGAGPACALVGHRLQGSAFGGVQVDAGFKRAGAFRGGRFAR